MWVRTLSTQPTLLRRDGCSTAGPPAGRTDSRPGSSPYLNTPTIEAQTERNRLPAPALQRPPCSQLLWVRPCQKRPANGTTPYSPSCDLGSPGITSPRLLRGVACGWFPSFSGLRIPCLGIKGIFFVCSPPPTPAVDVWVFPRRFSRANKAAGNTKVQIPPRNPGVVVFGAIPRSGIAGWYGSSIFGLSRTLPSFFPGWLHRFSFHVPTNARGSGFSTS